jgi:hypothetical protein
MMVHRRPRRRRDRRASPPPADRHSAGVAALLAPPAASAQFGCDGLGDAYFPFTLMRTWYSENKYGNVTTAGFIETAERVSGDELSPFCDAWLFGTTRLPLPGA